jgi:hypothetical protein
MSRPITQTLMKITTLLDDHPIAEQEQAMAFLKIRYPSLTPAELAIEHRRCGDRERQALSRDMSREVVTANGGVPPTPYVATKASSSVSSEDEESLRQKRLDKAKALLEAGDYEFLQACPEPFRSQWVGDGEWWISLRDGYPKMNAQQQASRYMAWEGSKRKRDHRAALRNWIAKADRWREGDEMRKAVRR